MVLATGKGSRNKTPSIPILYPSKVACHVYKPQTQTHVRGCRKFKKVGVMNVCNEIEPAKLPLKTIRVFFYQNTQNDENLALRTDLLTVF